MSEQEKRHIECALREIKELAYNDGLDEDDPDSWWTVVRTLESLAARGGLPPEGYEERWAYQRSDGEWTTVRSSPRLKAMQDHVVRIYVPCSPPDTESEDG